jgi:tetratricopeptide (TPR) repeat protein
LRTSKTSTLSLTSIDDGSVSMDPVSPNSISWKTCATVCHSAGLPLEVEIVKEEEQSLSDWSGVCVDDDDDDDDCDSHDCDEEKCVATGSTSAAAWKHYKLALFYAESELYDECLKQVSAGLLPLQEQEQNVLYWTLTELRAVVWGRMGCLGKSLAAYQGILAHACESEQEEQGADQANLLYTCGKLSVSLNQFGAALEYYRRELEITKTAAQGASHSDNHLAVARIYHELARVSVKGLGDSKQALAYYQEALQVEMAVWKELSAATVSCPLCRSGKKRSKFCAAHATRAQEVLQQIQDTKRSMGRIHFEQGDLDQAVRLI